MNINHRYGLFLGAVFFWVSIQLFQTVFTAGITLTDKQWFGGESVNAIAALPDQCRMFGTTWIPPPFISSHASPRGFPFL